jgi:hypothetical protein
VNKELNNVCKLSLPEEELWWHLPGGSEEP